MLQEDGDNRPAEQMVNLFGNFPEIEMQKLKMQYFGFQLFRCWTVKVNRLYNCCCCSRSSQTDMTDKALKHVVEQIDVEECLKQSHEHQRSQNCETGSHTNVIPRQWI